MLRRNLIPALLVMVVFLAGRAGAQEVLKIGIVMPMTGAFASAGRQVLAGVRLFIQQHGASVAGRKIEIVVKDDASIPDVSKRMAQELIVSEKVNLIGAGLTPNALAIAPLSLQAKIPIVLMISGTSFVTEKSPYIVRTSFTLGQQSAEIADWVVQNGSKRTVVVQSDFAPGAEASSVFMDRFTKGGGKILENLKVPLANPDFAPFLQRVRDLNPDTLFRIRARQRTGRSFREAVRRAGSRQGRYQIDRDR